MSLDNKEWLNYIATVKKIKSYKTPKATLKPKYQKNLLETNSSFYKVDLHGLTEDQAFTKLSSFLKQAYENNQKQVIIVTGKGTEEKPGVIKLAVPRWLQYTEINHFVASYSGAHPRSGGEGAIIAQIKHKKGANR